MAYLYEDKELVYVKQMRNLKKRIVLVNLIIFLTNLLATLILIFNQLEMWSYLQLIIPVFVLNLVISYAMVINRDSYQQLYLAMYISIIGIIVVVLNIFLISKTPAAYMLLYLAMAMISIYNDKKAVALGYSIIFVFGTIIHFKHTNMIIGYNSTHGELTAFLYETLLILTIIVQIGRMYFNEAEIDQLYSDLDERKEMELKYHTTIYDLLEKQNLITSYNDHYVTDETKKRLANYLSLFNHNFYLVNDLNEKLEQYLLLQREKDIRKVVGRRLVGYQLRKEIDQFEAMSTYKPSKFLSLLFSLKYKKMKGEAIDRIKNFDLMFVDPEMDFDVKILGFVLLYDHLRTPHQYARGLSHEEVVELFQTREANEIIDKEILKFFLENHEAFASIYEGEEEQSSQTGPQTQGLEDESAAQQEEIVNE